MIDAGDVGSVLFAPEGLLVVLYTQAECESHINVYSIADFGVGLTPTHQLGPSGDSDGSLLRPTAMCLDSKTGRLLVADRGNRIQEFDIYSGYTRTLKWVGIDDEEVEEGKREVSGLTMDSNRRLLYVSFGKENVVRRFVVGEEADHLQLFDTMIPYKTLMECGRGGWRLFHPTRIHFNVRTMSLVVLEQGAHMAKCINRERELEWRFAIFPKSELLDIVVYSKFGWVLVTSADGLDVFSISEGKHLGRKDLCGGAMALDEPNGRVYILGGSTPTRSAPMVTVVDLKRDFFVLRY